MLKINRIDNSVVIEGINNNLYPDNGTVTFPLNSIVALVDKSNIVTFKSAANGDVLFSGKVEDITINDASVTKESVLTQFNAISNAAQGGGGTGGGAVDSVNGKTGVVFLTAKDVNAYSKKEIDDKGFLTSIPEEYVTETELNNKNYATNDEVANAVADKITQNELDTAIQGVEGMIPDISNLATKNEVNVGLEAKADKTAIADMATQSWVGEQDYATNALVESKLDKNTYNEDKKTFALKSDLTPLATKEEVKLKQDKLVGTQVEGQNIKTINGQTLLGTGNIEITAGGGGGKVDSVNGQVGNVVLTAKDLNVYTIEEIDNKNFLTSIPDEYTTDSELSAALAGKVNTSDIADMATKAWVNGEKFLKEVPSEYVTDTELAEKNYATVSQLPDVSGKLDTSVYNKDKATFALKSEIPSIEGLAKESTVNEALALKADKTAITDMATQTWVGEQDYATKDELPSLAGYATQAWVGEQGYLTAIPDNIATDEEVANAVADKVSTSALNEAIQGVEGKIPQTDNLATKAEIADMATKTWVGDQNYSKTVKLTQSEYDQLPSKDPDTLYIISDAEAIDISGKLDKSTYEADKVTFATKSELAEKANLSSIADMATQTWVRDQRYDEKIREKQDELIGEQIVGQNIKTINGESLLGTGNIVIESGGGTGGDSNTYYVWLPSPAYATYGPEGAKPSDGWYNGEDAESNYTQEMKEFNAVAFAAMKIHIANDTKMQINALTKSGSATPNTSFPVCYTAFSYDSDRITMYTVINHQNKDNYNYVVKMNLATNEFIISESSCTYIPASGGGSSITVDAEINANSENPVQNKVIDAALKTKADVSAIPTKYLEDVTVKGSLNTILSFSGNTPRMQPRIPSIMLGDKDAEFVTINGNRIFNFGSEHNVGDIGNLDLATKAEIAGMATQAWVNQQINAAIAEVSTKIADIQNKIGG